MNQPTEYSDECEHSDECDNEHSDNNHPSVTSNRQSFHPLRKRNHTRNTRSTRSNVSYDDLSKMIRSVEDRIDYNQRKSEMDNGRSYDLIYRHMDLISKQIELISDNTEYLKKNSNYRSNHKKPDRYNDLRVDGKGYVPEEFIVKFDDILPSGYSNTSTGLEGNTGKGSMNILNSLLSSFGGKGLGQPSIEGKPKTNDINYDSDNYEDVSEYGSEDEFEELDLNIKTIDDLIRLGNLYPKLMEEVDTNSEDTTLSKPINMADEESRKLFKQFGISDEDINVIVSESINKMDINGKLAPIVIPLKIPLGKLSDIVPPTPITTPITDNNDKVVPLVTSSYKLNGKRYSINLEILYNLIKPLERLNAMVGLEKVKESVVNFILYKIQSFEKSNNSMLHIVIEGPPGVGKTKLGKILAQIYAAMKLVKTNKFVIARRTDLIGEYLGHTAQKTQNVINDAADGVLFIDEAYSLGNEDKRDSYSKECLDTLNQNLSENKKNIICIIAGYPEELERCFFSVNPGLKRRFPFKFTIDKYSAEELKDIFMNKIHNSKWKLNDDKLDESKLLDFFKDNMENFPYYGGDMENLLTECKLMHSRRIVGLHPKHKRKLSKDDIFNGFDSFMSNKLKKESSEPLPSMYT
jgi:adenylate kinase family enzyme